MIKFTCLDKRVLLRRSWVSSPRYRKMITLWRNHHSRLTSIQMAFKRPMLVHVRVCGSSPAPLWNISRFGLNIRRLGGRGRPIIIGWSVIQYSGIGCYGYNTKRFSYSYSTICRLSCPVYDLTGYYTGWTVSRMKSLSLLILIARNPIIISYVMGARPARCFGSISPCESSPQARCEPLQERSRWMWDEGQQVSNVSRSWVVYRNRRWLACTSPKTTQVQAVYYK